MNDIEHLLRALFLSLVVSLALWRWLPRGLTDHRWRVAMRVSAALAAAASLLDIYSILFVLLLGQESITVERALHDRFFGPHSGIYWASILLRLLPLALLAIPRARRSWWGLWLCALLLLDPLGLFERSVLLITSLHRDYLPSSWTMIPMALTTPLVLLFAAVIMASAQYSEKRLHRST